MQLAKKKLSDPDKKTILEMVRKGKGVVEIAQTLGIHGQVVNGFVSTARRRGFLLAPPPSGMPRPMLPPTQEEQLQALDKSWRKSEPDAEFSLHTGGGQRLYMAVYKEGLVMRLGENKKVALLTPLMASRAGSKIMEMANWSRLRPS